MDRALKERIVGATVLVVIAVLVVPVFLDGPSDAPQTVTETVTLPGQSEQNTRRQTIVLERDREQPVPPGTASGDGRDSSPDAAADAPAVRRAVAPAEKPVPAPVEEKTAANPPRQAASNTATREDAAPAPAAAPAESATGMWAVQLGSFSNEANAERLAADLRKEGYAAFLSRVRSGSEVLHRVRVGPQQDRAGAEKIAAKLADAGHTGQVVPHP